MINLECKPNRRIKGCDNAGFGDYSQGYRDSKSTGGIAVTALPASKRRQYGGIVAAGHRLSRNRGHIAS